MLYNVPPSVHCRSCGSQPLTSVLDLGRTPLANRLLRCEEIGQVEPRYPLELAFCTDCSLLQITETVEPEVLFRDYVYFSSFSDALLAHAKELAEKTVAQQELGPTSLVVEAASNDGYLLQYFRDKGIPVLGVEPARSVAAVAREKGIETIEEFFGSELAIRLLRTGKPADLLVANNVLAHVANLNDFVRGVQILLSPTGIAVFEIPYVKELVDGCEFDTIYHEHLCYYSLTALDPLFQRHGLVIVDVEQIPIHGGSLRITAARKDTAKPRDTVQKLLDQERCWGVGQLDYYADFGEKVEALKHELLSRLRYLKERGHRLAAYGASAKGSTLMNCFNIGRELLDFVVDRSTIKQGLYTSGGHLPIFAPEKLLQQMPDYVLLLTWNFADEILRQQKEYLRRGGQFIIPIPEVKVVGFHDISEAHAGAVLPT